MLLADRRNQSARKVVLATGALDHAAAVREGAVDGVVVGFLKSAQAEGETLRADGRTVHGAVVVIGCIRLWCT